MSQGHSRWRKPWTLPEIRAAFASRGCTLLAEVYFHRTPLAYRCAAGHEHAIRLTHFIEGHGCPRCRNERRWAGRRIDLGTVEASIVAEGYSDVQVERGSRSRVLVRFTCGCGRRVETSLAHFRAGQRCRSCSRRGDKNHNFNRAITTEERVIRRQYDEYYEWRWSVFCRDRFTCRKCAATGTGTYLVAHHVVGYRVAPDLRTVVSNGVTLCRPCHLAFHRSYGFKSATPEHLAIFLGGETRATCQ